MSEGNTGSVRNIAKKRIANRLREQFASSNNVAFLQKKATLIIWLLSIFSVRPKFGFGIGNRNQGPISVLVLE